MKTAARLVGLSIEASRTESDAPNFRPTCWPPRANQPVTIDASGAVISRFKDSSWILTPWTHKAAKLNFGDGPGKGKARRISPDNADLLRTISAWWLWGANPVRTGSELLRRFELFRPIFVLCSAKGIPASDLMRFQQIRDCLPLYLAKSQRRNLTVLLHELWDHRDDLGFVLLDPHGIVDLARQTIDHRTSQTAYIPPRIWLYQLSRIRACLDDFNAHDRQIAAFYEFCVEAYAHNAGSLAAACAKKLPPSRSPFAANLQRLSGKTTGCVFHGSFLESAERFGVRELLERWVSHRRKSPLGIVALSKYFTLIGQIGIAYLISLSLMRIDEAWSLRSDCLISEKDELGDDLFTIRGTTTKTITDDDARWITSPSAAVAVSAMRLVSSLRMRIAAEHPLVPVGLADTINPYLITRAYEPWVANAGDIAQPLAIRPLADSYNRIVRLNPRVFDADQLRITQDDLAQAVLFTPSLDSSRFAVGMAWPLAWHQLRRTGAVSMAASGVVSDASVQYQLKHASRAMTKYYAQGAHHLSGALNQSAKDEYLRAMYESISQNLIGAIGDRYISPYGPDHKRDLLSLVSGADHNELLGHARAGRIAYRETLLGVCLNTSACEKGGIESVAPCGAVERPCAFLLYDRSRIAHYQTLKSILSARLLAAEPKSPLHSSLEAQVRATEAAIHACESGG